MTISEKIAKNSASLVFYMDNIFGAFNTYQEQYIFLYDYFFPQMVWSKLKLLLIKLKVGITKIFALGEEHKIGGKVRLKSDKIEKILNWPVPQDQTKVKAFLGTIQSKRQKVKWR